MTEDNCHNSLFFKPIEYSPKPLVAISACLNGEPVRYDGTDKYQTSVDKYLVEQLKLLPICPEVEAGLGTPRPPVQLVQGGDQILAIGRDDPTLDVTQALVKTSQQFLKALSKKQLCGLMLKARSPSCGLNNTPVFNRPEKTIATDSGLYTRYFQQQMPWLFFRDESQLLHQQQCEHFITACQLSDNFQQGIKKHGFVPLKQHYAYLFAANNKEKWMANNEKEALLMLKQRLEEIITDLNDGNLFTTLLQMKSEARKRS